MSEEFLSLFITVRDGMYYFRAREIFKNLGYEYRQRERGFNGTGAVFLKQIPDGMKIGHGYQTFLSYDGVCEVFKLAQGGDVAFTVRRWGEKAEKRLKFMQFFFDNFSSEVCRRSGAEIKNPQFEHLLKMRRSDSMNDEQRYEIASELLRSRYPAGTRVELLQMDDVQAPPIGTKGTVTGVDDTGSLMVNWDNGSGLNVIYGIDRVRKTEE